MARGALTERMVKQAKPGVLIDGDGLRLKTTRGAGGKSRKSWLLRVTVKGGPERELGLGSADDVSLAEARNRAREFRRLARDGVDPLALRRAERAARAAEAARAMTFRQCAEAYIAAHRAGWRNAKHAAQWPSTLASYVYPVFGEVSVGDVDVTLVMRVLDPIWETKTETASRVRQRIEAVLNWAKARGLRTGENPAQWRGHLQNLLPPRAKVAPIQHHPAMAYDDVPALMAELGERDHLVSALALRFVILTAARTSEVLGARWDEIDLVKAEWRIPAGRMKAGREHRVPLSKQALALVRSTPRSGALLFPGFRPGQPLSNMVFKQLLRRLGYTEVTTHGFRSSFRDWAAEQTDTPGDVAEAALAHIVANKVEAAYRRGDQFAKRRRLMQAWADHCTKPIKRDAEQCLIQNKK